METDRQERARWLVPAIVLVLALVLLAVEWGGWGKAEPAAASGSRPRKPKPPVPIPAVKVEVTPAPVVHEEYDEATGAIIDVPEIPEPTELPALEASA